MVEELEGIDVVEVRAAAGAVRVVGEVLGPTGGSLGTVDAWGCAARREGAE